MFPGRAATYNSSMKNTLFVVAFALFSLSAEAQIFRLRITDYDGADAIPAVKNFIDTEIQKVENEINKDLPSAPPKRLMEGMADSSVAAGKGIGSDYASNMDVLLIGAGVGVGADLEKDKNTDSEMSGVGVAPGIIVGMNLAWMDARRFMGMDTDRLNVYFNFMKYTLDQTLNDKPNERSEAELDMLAMGVHFRYDWIKGNGSKWLGWGGVKFHFGYEYNKTDLTFSSQINETVNETSSNGEVISGTVSGSPSAKIAVNTHSIPIELSTDVQFLYILSLYTGLGVDYNFGQAKGSGALNGNESPVTCTGGSCTGAGDPTVLVKPEANIDATGKVTAFTPRAFVGLQVNIPYVRVFVQADKVLGNEVVGATAGVRFVY